MEFLALAALLLGDADQTGAPPQKGEGEYQIAGSCFLDDDYESGMNRICLYDCLSGTVAITISVTQICPLTIQE